MLRDMKPGVPNEPLVDVLAEAPVEFYLTGSHYFQCARPDSDIDFMTQDDPTTVAFLRANGFKSMRDRSKYVSDSILTAEVFENGHGKVQVQLCHKVMVKRQVRDVICTFLAEWHRTANREERTWLWNTLGKALQPELFGPVDLVF